MREGRGGESAELICLARPSIQQSSQPGIRMKLRFSLAWEYFCLQCTASRIFLSIHIKHCYEYDMFVSIGRTFLSVSIVSSWPFWAERTTGSKTPLRSDCPPFHIMDFMVFGNLQQFHSRSYSSFSRLNFIVLIYLDSSRLFSFLHFLARTAFSFPTAIALSTSFSFPGNEKFDLD